MSERILVRMEEIIVLQRRFGHAGLVVDVFGSFTLNLNWDERRKGNSLRYVISKTASFEIFCSVLTNFIDFIRSYFPNLAQNCPNEEIFLDRENFAFRCRRKAKQNHKSSITVQDNEPKQNKSKVWHNKCSQNSAI